jgi:hypothetical protein
MKDFWFSKVRIHEGFVVISNESQRIDAKPNRLELESLKTL